ncbi:MAG: transketolase C-terminal domain-containing protein, partial [Candidatus Microbacterium stercoravium]
VDAADALNESVGAGTAAVYDVHTIKPLDLGNVIDALDDASVVLVVEEHNVEGGLGTMVVEQLAQHGITNPVHKHGLQDEFVIVGPPAHLYTYYGLDAGGIQAVAERLIADETLSRTEPLWTSEDRAEALARVRERRTNR